MAQHNCNLQIHVNGQHTFYLNERTVSSYSARLKRMIKQDKRKTQIKKPDIKLDDFPGGPDGFELVCRFCYNRGCIHITPSNVSLLHCSAVFLGMTDKISTGNLLQQTETFLQGSFEWPWNDVVLSLKSCESFLAFAEAAGLVTKLICALLAKIARNSEIDSAAAAAAITSSSSSSPETTLGSRSALAKSWWFDDLTVLSPSIIEKIVKGLGAFGMENNSIVLTRFLVHYLKTVGRSQSNMIITRGRDYFYVGIADTAVHGIISAGKSAFSCRGLFRVLRILSAFRPSKDCRLGLERLIGGMLDEANLDDLLVSSAGSGGRDRGVYDVNLLVRLIRVFVNNNYNYNDEEGGGPGGSGSGSGSGSSSSWSSSASAAAASSSQRMKKVGRLVDKYLREIAPDQNLKMSKFLGVAESLPDSARGSFDGVYRAIDIFLESHPSLSFEERSRLCTCLNYEKLSLEACKDLAKNPKIPPRVAVEALMCQQQPPPEDNQYMMANCSTSMRIINHDDDDDDQHAQVRAVVNSYDNGGIRVLENDGAGAGSGSGSAEYSCSMAIVKEKNQDMRMNLEKMQWRVVELEKVCKQMKSQMSKMVRHPVVSGSSTSTSTRPPLAGTRLC